MKEEIDFEDFAPWLAVALTLVGGWLRVFLLDNKGMWLDETFSIWLASHSTLEMMQWIVKIDQHPPFYYLLLHYWIASYGDTPYYVRLLSALFGTLTIPIIYLIGKRISSVQVGLAAAVFMCFSTFNIYYAQEARMYTLLMFNAAMAIYALTRLLTDSRSILPIGSQFQKYIHAWRASERVKPDTKRDLSYEDEIAVLTGWRGWIYHHRWVSIQTIDTDLSWVAFIVFSAATLLTHNTAIFFSLATNIFVLGLMLFQWINKSGTTSALQPPSISNWVKAQIGVFILWSPWIFAFIQQARRVNQEFWLPKPDWETITQTLRALLNASAPNQISQVMTWVLCVVLCLGLIYYRKNFSIFLFLVVLFTIPVLGELIVSIHRPIFIDRTLIWITIPMFIVLAAGIAQLRFRLLIILVMGGLATNYLFATGDYYRFYQKEDWSNPAGYVANFIEKDDLIIFNSNMVRIPFEYYFKTWANLYDLQAEKHGVPEDLFDSGILEPKMTESDIPKLISLLNGHNRVWLVYSHNSYTDPMGLIPQTLASRLKLIQQRDFYGVQVLLYETP